MNGNSEYFPWQSLIWKYHHPFCSIIYNMWNDELCWSVSLPYFLYFVFGLGKVEYDIFPVQYLYFCNPAFMTWITLTILVELLYASWGRTCYQSGITRAWINCFSVFEAGPRRPDEEQVNGVLDGCTQPQHIRLKINISWVCRDTERRGEKKNMPHEIKGK